MDEVERKLECIARAAHEVNRAYCIAIGDNSQLPWDQAAEWQRKSAIEGIQVALDGASPREQHAAWASAKLRDGWKFGLIKDAEKKTHPCLVDYGELPEAQRKKDTLFICVVRAMAAATGTTIQYHYVAR